MPLEVLLRQFTDHHYLKHYLKPRPNVGNISTQQIARLLCATCCVCLDALLQCLMGVVGSTSLTNNTQGGQTHATWDGLLTWDAKNVAICRKNEIFWRFMSVKLYPAINGVKSNPMVILRANFPRAFHGPHVFFDF